MKVKGRARLFTALLVSAIALVSLGFFQGFEIDTSDWFHLGAPYDQAIVNRVAAPNQSVTYNSGTTSRYGDTPINAALGAYFGRVTSAISSGTCVIDDTGPGSISSLLCYGPYTHFGLTPLPVAHAFPPLGYTTQVDIYLDVTYASRHPDCGLEGAPCTPETPGTVNPACLTDPPGTDCEGSRFTWTLGVNHPDGSFLQDYVFQVGTAPDPSGVFGGCTEGYIINAQYNSFRSGNTPYNPGFEPKCITQSGWYTFKQVFKNDGSDNLEVDFSILDSTGSVATCKDTTGANVPCSWIRYPGHTLADVGCPAYGWLANEEINDLPVDNTKFTGECGQPQVGRVLPTDTTCQQYASDTAAVLEQLTYTTRGSTISSASPGVFFYYTKVSGAQGDTVGISQSHTGTAPSIPILKSQIVLYSTTCSKLKWRSPVDINPDGTATGTLPSAGEFIVGVKYNSSLKSQPSPNPETITYTLDVEVNGVEQDAATIDLVKRLK